ncbi:Hypothetical predicted protein [Podarcis lilfordi]|uniref:Uncharacterized protein n=1 Tax=Podarcis lilfordi TaxID=74358 RepID=A0AA35VVZ1_9SAUR|nr:Hypothetical predicted protein [Podarcis lilfordi]
MPRRMEDPGEREGTPFPQSQTMDLTSAGGWGRTGLQGSNCRLGVPLSQPAKSSCFPPSIHPSKEGLGGSGAERGGTCGAGTWGGQGGGLAGLSLPRLSMRPVKYFWSLDLMRRSQDGPRILRRAGSNAEWAPCQG